MTCAGCVARIERSLAKVEGVEQVEVNLLAERASISGKVDGQQLIQAVERLGFGAESIVDLQGAREQLQRDLAHEQRRLGRQCMWAVALTTPVFVIEMGRHLIPGMHGLFAQVVPDWLWLLLMATLATAVQFGPGWSFYRRGMRSLRHGAPDMNAMVMLGTSAAWLYSLSVCVLPNFFPEAARQVYFEASAVIISLVLLGRWLESRAKGRSGAAIQKLLKLQIPQARVQRDGKETTVPVEALSLGDEVVLRAGEQIPVDAVLINGSLEVNESMLTGESTSRAKALGDTVVAGTMVVDGFAKVAVSALGANTVLAQMIHMVERAQSAKIPLQALIDRVTAIFVPVILGVACITTAVWLIFGPDPRINYALVTGISVLIIACPCAMGLATPISILVGIGRAAERGVLFRQGDALQSLHEVDVVAFDKTGTLTQGQLTVHTMVPTAASGLQEKDLLALAAAVEQGSRHPIAQAIQQAAIGQDIALPQPQDVQVHVGFGLSATVNEQRVVVGSAACLERFAGITSQEFDVFSASIQHGLTRVFVAQGNTLIGYIAVADTLRPEARDLCRTITTTRKADLYFKW